VQAHQGVNPSTFFRCRCVRGAHAGRRDLRPGVLLPRGQNWGNRPYFPRHDRDLPTAEVLEAFIGQFYDERTAPTLVVVGELPNQDLLAEALSLRSERKVEMLMPQRGEKRRSSTWRCRMRANSWAQAGGERRATRIARRRGRNLRARNPAARIEVYDNSHIQGTNALGAMIVAGADGFEKGEYRKFNIKSTELTPGDDYGMMREVLTRRFSRLVKESEADEAKAKWPDLVLIDGGPGQLAVASACSKIWAWRTCCWWASPRDRIATPGASIST
jgi:excinuclease ABC subunit C